MISIGQLEFDPKQAFNYLHAVRRAREFKDNWCSENCEGAWGLRGAYEHPVFDFSFELATDAVKFKLALSNQ